MASEFESEVNESEVDEEAAVESASPSAAVARSLSTRGGASSLARLPSRRPVASQLERGSDEADSAYYKRAAMERERLEAAGKVALALTSGRARERRQRLGARRVERKHAAAE